MNKKMSIYIYIIQCGSLVDLIHNDIKQCDVNVNVLHEIQLGQQRFAFYCRFFGSKFMD